MPGPLQTLLLETDDVPGVLWRIAAVFANHGTNIRGIQTFASAAGRATVTIEIDGEANADLLVSDLQALPVVHRVDRPPSLLAIYGKRVIIIGGGAQVGQVAVGAISEADRHNIRGERISVDTIPLVGEQALAAAVRAVARLPRAEVLVLAGALMGGGITDAVREIQQQGLIVVALNMVGSVREVADLVVTDPLQAGVMAVMAIADTATFDIAKQRGKQVLTDRTRSWVLGLEFGVLTAPRSTPHPRPTTQDCVSRWVLRSVQSDPRHLTEPCPSQSCWSRWRWWPRRSVSSGPRTCGAGRERRRPWRRRLPARRLVSSPTSSCSASGCARRGRPRRTWRCRSRNLQKGEG